MNTARLAALAAPAAVACAFALPATAQEAINTPAATQPSAGRFVLREQARYLRLDDDPVDDLDRQIDQLTLVSSLAYGVTGNFSLNLDLSAAYRDTDFRAAGEREIDRGLSGLALTGKLRVYRDDFGPIDTLRASVLAGLEVPVGPDSLGPPSVAPMIGAVATYVHGRHGLNAAARWTFTTGEADDPVRPGESLADLLRYDLAYLYRVTPAVYTGSTTAALYGVLELNGLYETNGDHQIYLSPGLLYEAQRWAAELSVQIPVYQDLDHRPESDYALVLGLRLLF